jgi:hypothetical protein
MIQITEGRFKECPGRPSPWEPDCAAEFSNLRLVTKVTMVLFEIGYTVLDLGFLKWNIRVPRWCNNREWMPPVAPQWQRDMQAWNEMVRSCIQWVGADVAN